MQGAAERDAGEMSRSWELLRLNLETLLYPVQWGVFEEALARQWHADGQGPSGSKLVHIGGRPGAVTLIRRLLECPSKSYCGPSLLPQCSEDFSWQVMGSICHDL